MPGVSAGEAMKRLKGRAARMVAKVLEGGLNVPDELRGTYLDAVWRGVREAGWPGRTAREAELLHDQAVAASLALNLHEIGEKFRAEVRAEEAAREAAPIVDHPSHRFEGDEPQCVCGAYPVRRDRRNRACPILRRTRSTRRPDRRGTTGDRGARVGGALLHVQEGCPDARGCPTAAQRAERSTSPGPRTRRTTPCSRSSSGRSPGVSSSGRDRSTRRRRVRRSTIFGPPWTRCTGCWEGRDERAQGQDQPPRPEKRQTHTGLLISRVPLTGERIRIRRPGGAPTA